MPDTDLTNLLNLFYEYEVNHQQTLFYLLKKDKLFAEILLGENILDNYEVVIEGERKAFDIIVNSGEKRYLMELKMNAFLFQQQLDKQKKYFDSTSKGIYILLGYSDLFYFKTKEKDNISELTKSQASKIGYNQLSEILIKYISRTRNEICRSVAEMYYKHLKIIQEELVEKTKDEKNIDKNFKTYYSYHFGKIRQRLDFTTELLREGVANTKKTMYLKDASSFHYKSIKVFQEFENNKLFIKANIDLIASDSNRSNSDYNDVYDILKRAINENNNLASICVFQKKKTIPKATTRKKHSYPKMIQINFDFNNDNIKTIAHTFNETHSLLITTLNPNKNL